MKKRKRTTPRSVKTKSAQSARRAGKHPAQTGSRSFQAPAWIDDKLFRTLIENSSDAFSLMDSKGKILYRSPSAKGILKFSDSEILSKNIFDRIWPEDLKEARRIFKEILKSPRKKVAFEIRVTGKDEKPLWINGVSLNRLNEPRLQALVMHYRDVTKEKEAASALEESERSYRGLFENARLAVFQSSPEGKVIRVNHEFARVFGYRSPEDVLRSVRDVGRELFADPARRREIMRLQEQDPRQTTFDNLYLRKDGSTFWGRLNIRRVTDPEGKSQRFEGFIEDISKDHAMEGAIRESEEKFRSIFQNSPAGVALVGLDGRYLMVNPVLCEMVGYTEAEMLAMDFFKLTHPDDQELSRKALLGVLGGKGKNIRFDKRYLHKDGRTIWTEVSSVLVSDAAGRPSHFITQVIDITKRKQAEDALRDSEKRIRNLVDTSPDAITVTDMRGKITMANPQSAALFGMANAEELIGKDSFSLIAAEDREQALKNLQIVLAKGELRNIKNRLVRADGRLLPVEMNVSILQDAKGNPEAMIAVTRDVTERRQAEAALRESEERYRGLFQNSLEGIGLALGNKIVDANKALLEIFGYDDLEEFISIPLLEHVAPSSREFIIAYQEKVRKGEPVEPRFTYQILRKDKTIRDVEIAVEHIKIGDDLFTQSTFRDVTDRAWAEEALRDSEERYRLLFDFSPDSLAVYQDGKILYANPATFRLLGASAQEELIGRPMLDFVHPDYRELVLKRSREQEREGRSASAVEEKFVRVDGKSVDVEVMASPFQYRGKLSHLVISRDITERKRADEMLRDKEERFRATFENANVGVCIVGLDGRLIQVNQQMCAMFGYSRDELERMTVNTIAHPEDAAISSTFITQAVSGGEGEGGFDKRYIHKDGRLLWGHVSTSLVRDSAGSPLYFISHVQNITERKQAEEALRESKNQFSTAAIIARLGPWEYDVEKDLFTFNDQFYAVFKTTAAAVGGYTMKSADYAARFVHPDDRNVVGAKIREALETDDPNFSLQLEHRVINGDGTPGYISVHFFIIKDAKGKTIKTYGVNQDITERKQAEEALRSLAARHEALLSAIPEIVMEVDSNKVYTWANMAGKEFFGEDVIGREAAFYFEGDQDTYTTVQPLFTGSEDTLYVESWQRRKDGEKRLLGWWCRTLKDGRGAVTGALSSARDITEQRTAEERIQNLSRFPEENPNPVMRMTPAGVLLYANNASRLFLEYWDIEVGGVVPEECQIILREVFGNNRGKEVEKKLHQRIFSCTMAPIVSGGYINVYAREITTEKQADESLALQTEELRQRNQELARVNQLTERRLQQLAAMRTVDMAISSSFKSELVMEILLEQLTGQLKIHAADILIFHPAMQGFRFFCGRGFYSNPSASEYIRLSESYAGRAAQDRRTIKVPRLDEKTDQAKILPRIAKEGFVSYACLPLIAKGQIKGVMEVCQREPLELGPEEDAFLEMLAGQAAIAVDNAEMFGSLQTSRDELQLAFNSTLAGWARALELRDREGEGETQRAAELAMRLAQLLGEGDDALTHIYRGAILHDIGMMSVPDNVLLKRGPLTGEEWTLVRKHPQIAYDILSPVLFLRPALDIPHCHHEKWDGSGYPRGLKGDHIPLAARIFAVVDVWTALRSDRPYRKAKADSEADEYIRSQSGKHFDPAVVQAFFRLIGTH